MLVRSIASRNAADLDATGTKQPTFDDEQRRVQPPVTLGPCIEPHRQPYIAPFCRLISFGGLKYPSDLFTAE